MYTKIIHRWRYKAAPLTCTSAK